jgi:hypothetical protein
VLEQLRLLLRRVNFGFVLGRMCAFLCLRFDVLIVLCVRSLWTKSPEITFSQILFSTELIIIIFKFDPFPQLWYFGSTLFLIG